jgi:hypothetical protein
MYKHISFNYMERSADNVLANDDADLRWTKSFPQFSVSAPIPTIDECYYNNTIGDWLINLRAALMIL